MRSALRFYLVPDGIEVFQASLAEFPTALPQAVFHRVETRNKFVRRALQ